jgi:hypothetical protein
VLGAPFLLPARLAHARLEPLLAPLAPAPDLTLPFRRHRIASRPIFEPARRKRRARSLEALTEFGLQATLNGTAAERKCGALKVQQ